MSRLFLLSLPRDVELAFTPGIILFPNSLPPDIFNVSIEMLIMWSR